MLDTLIAEIKKIGDFSTVDIDLFLNSFSEKTIAKGEHFLVNGQVSKHIAYIKSGLMMYYKINKGIEIPADFTKEYEWLAYLKSFTTDTPSDMSIKALEESHLLILSKESMGKLFASQPKFMAIKSYYVELSFIRNSQHASNLATLNAKQRYEKFVQDFPDLVQRIPQYHIASYLGIKPQSLSRVRKS